MECVFVCVKESEWGVRGGGVSMGRLARFVCAACSSGVSRHIVYVAWEINTLQYLCMRARLSACHTCRTIPHVHHVTI